MGSNWRTFGEALSNFSMISAFQLLLANFLEQIRLLG